ncbi:lycopene cyclase domain-containing protein [Demequina aurantiaca]|uniref:lycopene cyclase domain-containing protein n=1 Tax=Demequina aurantiaca TaxID=676200 RepID=UPI0007801E81|nr:lycopene cyclase domain-containing protein [Demequina aurantiaca]
MTSWLYLLGLVFALLGLTTLDWRYRVALFDQARRAAATIGIGVAFFLVWDMIGVGFGIFFVGDAAYLTGLRVAPEVPIEELLFLTLLCYQTLLLWLAFSRRRATTTRGETTS